jgi:hypothetical protein
MDFNNTEYFDMGTMIAEYIEKGFLDNIVDMFKHDKSLYTHIGYLLSDERLRVRIGISALVDILKEEDPENISRVIPFIIPLLKDKNPILRGDAAYLLGIIGKTDVIPHLEESLYDEDANVRLISKEAIEEIILNLQSS